MDSGQSSEAGSDQSLIAGTTDNSAIVRVSDAPGSCWLHLSCDAVRSVAMFPFRNLRILLFSATGIDL